jgi:hypothetical protein
MRHENTLRGYFLARKGGKSKQNQPLSHNGRGAELRKMAGVNGAGNVRHQPMCFLKNASVRSSASLWLAS